MAIKDKVSGVSGRRFMNALLCLVSPWPNLVSLQKVSGTDERKWVMLDDVSTRDAFVISAVIYADDVSSCSGSHVHVWSTTRTLSCFIVSFNTHRDQNNVSTRKPVFYFNSSRKNKKKSHSEPELQHTASREEERKKRDSTRAQPIIWCIEKRSL